MKRHARVAVIGGGMMGCSLLFHLARAGWTEAVLFEKSELTAGSTWHAAGLCTHFAHDVTVMNLRARSIRLYNGLLEAETGFPVSFHPVGALRVTANPDRMDEFRHVRGLGRFAGHDFHILDPRELKEIYPLVETDGLIGAIHEPNDGYVDPSQAAHAMARAARGKGVEIYRNNPVLGIRRDRGEWVIDSKDGRLRAEHVVNAAGTWCREIGAMMGIDLPVVPMLHQYIVTDRIDDFATLGRELPMIRDPDRSWYLRQERDGVIIGPYEKSGRAWSIDGVPPEFGMELLPGDLDRIEDIASSCMERVPAVGLGGVKSVVNGPITFTPDAGPLIGPAFGLPNAWLLTGSSMGVMEGGGAGEFLARWMMSGSPPADPAAIDPRRFGGYADRAYRIEKAAESYSRQFAIHYPYEQLPAGRMKRIAPIYERLKDLGARYGTVNGWERPEWFDRQGRCAGIEYGFGRGPWFEDVAGECRDASRAAVIGDLSVFSKFAVQGASAGRFVDALGANGAPRRDGGIAIIHALHPDGGVASEFTVTRIHGGHYHLVSAAAAERHDEDLLRSRAAPFTNLEISNVTGKMGVLGVMGPAAASLLSGLGAGDLSAGVFPWMSARAVRCAGIDVLAMRISYIGEPGFELHHDLDDQAALFEALWRAGQPLGAGLYGAFATNSMRLEKGYRAWGADLTCERTLHEAGLDLFVKTAGREFVGKEAMLERTGRDGNWHMKLLALKDPGAEPFHGHAVLADGRAVGAVTSGGYGHRTAMPLALCWLREDVGRLPLHVDILGRTVEAGILKQPPYDPGNVRMRM